MMLRNYYLWSSSSKTTKSHCQWKSVRNICEYGVTKWVSSNHGKYAGSLFSDVKCNTLTVTWRYVIKFILKNNISKSCYLQYFSNLCLKL